MKNGYPSDRLSSTILRWICFLAITIVFSTGLPFNQPGQAAWLEQVSSLPDLTITDLWFTQSSLCYQLLNQGSSLSPAGHTTQAERDGTFFALETVEFLLKPTERLERCFTPTYTCTGSQDIIQVCSDSKNTILESDENNNCRQETWNCDQTAPLIFKGPQATEVTQISTMIYWETDEPADSTVEYSLQAGVYEMVAINQQPVQVHKILLSGLKPASLYQYRVRSSDASGNQQVSAPAYFKTLSPSDQKPPTIGNLTIQHRQGEYVAYEIEAPVTDDQLVQRVELYLDKKLVGINYSPQPGTHSYPFLLAPGALGLSHADFFNLPHTLEVKAFDAAGNASNFYPPWAPTVEPMDGELNILAPAPDFTIYVPEGATDFYEVPIQVYAVENVAELCLPPGVGGDLRCVHTTQAVKKVEFYINGVLKHTSVPTDTGQTLHDYTWNASWLPLGDYLLRVVAYADDDAVLSATRTIRIRQGEAHLEVERQVSQASTWFDVALTLRNTGTLKIILFDLQDNLTGFQVLPKNTESYTVQPSYNHWLDSSQVLINLHNPPWHSYELLPGDILHVGYRAMPILKPPSHWRTYSIGAEPIQVNRRVNYVDAIEYFERPAVLTNAGEPIAEAVAQAQANADYLIVTNPERLYYHNASTSDVDRLLSALGELAEVKHGILGYMEGPYNAGVVDEQIESWGASMRGSDDIPGQFLNNGYLLIVGENEIVPAGSITISHWWYDDFTISLTDVYYADTISNVIDPELQVGRIIGNNAWELLLPIHTIINLYRHTPGFNYDRSDALVVSGFPETRRGGANYSNFAGVRQDVVYQLDRQGVTTHQLHTPDYPTAAEAVLAFLSRIPGMDILHLAGHGSEISLDDFDIYTLDADPDPFGDANPIVFASSCNTGIYNRGTSLAEKFIQHGAGVYLGATAVSYSDTNRAAANAVHARLTPGRSFGSIVNEVKIGFGSGSLSGYAEDVWSAEYHLFGDPEYGADLGIGLSQNPILPARLDFSASPVTIQSTVPDYRVTHQADGTDWVEIPGGGWVQEIGKPLTPSYTLFSDIPSDYIVQDVRLIERGGESLASYLNLPLATFAIDDLTTQIPFTPWPADSEWWPERGFEWRVSQNLDGSSRLSIVLYPFIYNSLTQQARFYQDYTFEITTIPSGPRLVELALDQLTYQAGQPMRIELQLNNPAQAIDAFLEVKLFQPGNPEPVTGLPLYPLDGIVGNALVSLDYSTEKLLAGDYILLAELRSIEGALYDSRQENFRIGARQGIIEAFTVSPIVFIPGQAVNISFNFRNTGSQTLDGQAVIEIHDLQNEQEQRYELEFSDLAPQQSLPVEWTWQTTPATQGKYRVTTYVDTNPEITSAQWVEVRSYRWLYLPLGFR